MALSRYLNFNSVIDPQTAKPRFESFPSIQASELEDLSDIVIEWQEGMKLDSLAFEHLGDGRYWWAICVLNDINLPFTVDVQPGTLLRIPTNISRILNKIQSKIRAI